MYYWHSSSSVRFFFLVIKEFSESCDCYINGNQSFIFHCAHSAVILHKYSIDIVTLITLGPVLMWHHFRWEGWVGVGRGGGGTLEEIKGRSGIPLNVCVRYNVLLKQDKRK